MLGGNSTMISQPDGMDGEWNAISLAVPMSVFMHEESRISSYSSKRIIPQNQIRLVHIRVEISRSEICRDMRLHWRYLR